MFSRPAGDIEKLLSRLPRMPTSVLLDRIRKSGDINERMFDLTEKERFSNAAVDCAFYIKKVLP